MAQAAQGGEVAVEVELGIPEHLELDSYPGQLSQVLQALFENSVAHGFGGRSKGHVRISASLNGKGEVALVYADDGKGIAPEHLGRVYDPFFTTRRGTGGSGLGLYIAHNIISSVLGGRVKLASEPGQGAAFTLLLPPAAPL
jgi:signal transduction histidine kinase